MTAGYRKAALLLHTLCESDRDWLLQQLDETSRQELQLLLHELKDLGIPESPELLEGLKPEPASDSQPQTIDNLKRMLAKVPADVISRVVAKEPAAFLSMLLKMHDWPWRNGVLSLLGASRRRQVEVLLVSQRHPSFDFGHALLREVWLEVNSANTNKRDDAFSASEKLSLSACLANFLRKWL